MIHSVALCGKYAGGMCADRLVCMCASGFIYAYRSPQVGQSTPEMLECILNAKNFVEIFTELEIFRKVLSHPSFGGRDIEYLWIKRRTIT